MVRKEWKTEPNEQTWINRKTGLHCHITRHSGMGHLCGYVGVPRDHPLFGRTYWDLYEVNADIRVHGGITFASSIDKLGEDIWWFGFDCGHADDITPYSMMTYKETLGAKYRNIRYVRRHVRRLAEQLENRLKWLLLMGPADRKIQVQEDDN